MTQENFPQDDPEVFNELVQYGEGDAALGMPDELNTGSHAEQLQAGLLKVAQAAHDQIIGQGEQASVLPSSDGTVDMVQGTVYTYDSGTNTSYHIATYDNPGTDSVGLRIRSASVYSDKIPKPGFFKQHDLSLTYHKNGRVDDPNVYSDRLGKMESTVALDAKDPKAFDEMADSINRSHKISQYEFERSAQRAKDEFITGQVGRFAALRTIFGMEPQTEPMDLGDNIQSRVKE